jgi:hypothetical protein
MAGCDLINYGQRKKGIGLGGQRSDDSRQIAAGSGQLETSLSVISYSLFAIPVSCPYELS